METNGGSNMSKKSKLLIWSMWCNCKSSNQIQYHAKKQDGRTPDSNEISSIEILDCIIMTEKKYLMCNISEIRDCFFIMSSINLDHSRPCKDHYWKNAKNNSSFGSWCPNGFLKIHENCAIRYVLFDW